MVNTLDEIQKHQGLIRLLDSQPRLEDILYKKVGGEVELLLLEQLPTAGRDFLVSSLAVIL